MLHPTVRLLSWSVAATLAQYLPIAGLAPACAAALAGAAWLAPKRLALLLLRTRWLIASLVLLFALATPGVYVLPVLGSLGPTQEGIRLGLEHLMRLLIVLATLAILLHRTGMEGLLAGIYGLLLPLAWLGLDRGRVAVRLMLVMQYAEQSLPGRHWREWLQGEGIAAEPLRLRLPDFSLGKADFAVLAGLTFAVAIFIGAVA